MILKFLLIIIAATSFAHASYYHWSCSNQPGSRYFWMKGDKAGSRYYWYQGNGPGSKYYWDKGSGVGSKYFWMNGTTEGSLYFVHQGHSAGSRYYWQQGDKEGSQYHWQTGITKSVEAFYIPLCKELRLNLPICALINTVETDGRRLSCFSNLNQIINSYLNSPVQPQIDCQEVKEP